MMTNRDIYQKDPATQKLVNEGVASVNDDKTDLALQVLRYELETFVCDGQYEKGLAHILETFLSNINKEQQPAVWVSGFYGSGKSHLVKMLRALWEDTVFNDGATARNIAKLPQEIHESLKALTIASKRHGGLHAASGTLGAGISGSVRLALLRIIFKSADLPEQYHVARFVLWLRKEGILDQVRALVEDNGHDFEEELDNLYVAEGLHEALVALKPNLFSSTASCVETLNNLYPNVQDISSDEMIKTIRQAVSKDGKLPLLLIVLDEVQQYIGEDSQRGNAVQEVVEACCKNIGSNLLFIGTGQTAVTGTSNMKKLEGRFTIRIELSDSDVDAVIRKVVLAKKPSALKNIEQVMQTNLGEITRHLNYTTIGHRQEDLTYFPQDYPILPVRRRFWEVTLRVLDQTGTDSQLRNQLSMVHKVIQGNLDEPLGHVIPADYLYFDSAEKLLQARILPKTLHAKTMIWSKGTEEERLMARACGLIFLINKLGSQNNEIGIRANIDTLADLMVENLPEGSSSLRSKLPGLLDHCDQLMKIGDEYRIQTEESNAWNDEFQSQRSILANETHRIEAERDDRIRRKFNEIVRKLTLTQGNSKVTREIHPVFDLQLPSDAAQRVYVWVRTGWSVDEKSVQADARQVGTQAATIFVFIPKRSADDLRHYLINHKAADATLEKRGSPNTAEGIEARAAMETVRQTAENKIHELLAEAFSEARVYQGGGNELSGNDLQAMVLEAAGSALQRLYPQFHTADHESWGKVYERAQKGAPDALKMVGYDGEPSGNPVCKALFDYIGGGKKGFDIRVQFESSPFGWSRDAVDGALQVLLVAGLIRTQDEHGKMVGPKELERKNIGKVLFKVESATITMPQRIQIRKLFQMLGISTKSNEELANVPEFLQKIENLAKQAGGEAPKPPLPDIAFLEEIRLTAGNAQLLALHNRLEDLACCIDNWTELAKRVAQRWPNWVEMERLLGHAEQLDGIESIKAEIQVIKEQRQLIVEPDPVAPLLADLTQRFRDELNKLKQSWDYHWQAGEAKLAADANWQQLSPEQRHSLREKQQLVRNAVPEVMLKNCAAILATLDRISLQSFRDRIAAMPSRFNQVVLDAAKLTEPEVQEVNLPCRTLKSEEEVNVWIEEVRDILLDKIKKGPVIV